MSFRVGDRVVSVNAPVDVPVDRGAADFIGLHGTVDSLCRLAHGHSLGPCYMIRFDQDVPNASANDWRKNNHHLPETYLVVEPFIITSTCIHVNI